MYSQTMGVCCTCYYMYITTTVVLSKFLGKGLQCENNSWWCPFLFVSRESYKALKAVILDHQTGPSKLNTIIIIAGLLCQKTWNFNLENYSISHILKKRMHTRKITTTGFEIHRLIGTCSENRYALLCCIKQTHQTNT